MIKSLYIKDFALIDELEVEFGKGLNILTGETGAGKSIIIGALNMILGERADTEVVRQGSDKAIAEAILHIGEDPFIRSILRENAVDYSEELILRREIRQTASRAFINDTPVNIGVLKRVGTFLVDLHGQHDHQFLLDDENHRSVIDRRKEVSEFLDPYQEAWREMSELREQLGNLRRREAELQEKTELYRFQARELEEAKLDPEEEEQVEVEMKRLDNAEELSRKVEQITEIGSGEDLGLLELLDRVKLHLEDVSRIEPDFESYLDEVNSARISIQEAIYFAERYRDRIEFNPQRLEELRRRQSELNRLKKKYSRDLTGLIDYLEEIRNELDLAENFDVEIEALENRVANQAELLKERAAALHEIRQSTGKSLSGEIEEELKRLGIPHPSFEVRVDWLFRDEGWIEVDGRPVECTLHGCDDVRFFISTNRGEEPRPLARIASGGEISRVMLALKSIMAQEQRLPVMIFDEIDTGISGKISEKVGRSMRQLSGSCQIISITHQPQIASQAHHHYRVEKLEEAGRTVTRIIPLDRNEHIREVAGLMSGEEITKAALSSAEELIERNTNGG